MPKQQATILVVDDDPDILITAELLLKRHFSCVLCFDSPDLITETMTKETIDIFLLDMNFAIGVNTGDEGLHWLQAILSLNEHAVVILMTAYGDIETSVRAIKHGATDFVLKPWQNEKLLATLNAATQLSKSRTQVHLLKQQQAELRPWSEQSIIAESPQMTRLFKLANRAAETDVNVLVLGENGSGKEVVAHEIHRNSQREDTLMLSVDLGAVPENLFESELFGHVKGAFTDANRDRAGRFQAASGGTLFLDEIGNLPLHLQAKLLRVIESREVTPVGSDKTIPVDVRLICATNMPLQSLVDEGKFRADLFYRINTVQLEIPPLRERLMDIPLLLQFFIDKYTRKYNLAFKTISKPALKRLCSYPWPGNVRELTHAVERALIMSEHSELTEDDFLLRETQKDGAEGIDDFNLERVERRTVERAIKKHAGNISHAATELGITRTSLYRRIKKFQL